MNLLTHTDILPLINTTHHPTPQQQRHPLRHTPSHPPLPTPRRRPIPNPQIPYPSLHTQHSLPPLPRLPQPLHTHPLTPHSRPSSNTNLHLAPRTPLFPPFAAHRRPPVSRLHNPPHPPPKPNIPPPGRDPRLLLLPPLRPHPPQRLVPPATQSKRHRCLTLLRPQRAGAEDDG